MSNSSSRTLMQQSTCDIDYKTTMCVISSWYAVKRIPDYPLKAGQLLVTKLVQLEPECFSLLVEGVQSHPMYSSHTSWSDEDSVLGKQAVILIQMIDYIVSILGPDLESLTEEIVEFRQRYQDYGVRPKHIRSFEKALLHTLKRLLGSAFTKNEEHAWNLVHRFITDSLFATTSSRRGD